MTTDNPVPPAPSRWNVKRIALLAVVSALAGVFGLMLLGTIATWYDLPGCDSKRAKDMLSTFFIRNKVDPTRYDEIRTLTTRDDEIACFAKMTLRSGGSQEFDYKLLRENGETILRVTRSNP